MPVINERLQDPAISGDLKNASSETLEAVVLLFGVLETTPTKYVRLTTLSKVLHRKRPGLLPLYDNNIGYCYSECPGAPLPYREGRTRRDYRRAWLSAVQNDLARQLPHWKEIAAMAPGPKITPLRALNISRKWPECGQANFSSGPQWHRRHLESFSSSYLPV